jgi:hypothetical protein
MAQSGRPVKIRINQQQAEVLERLRKEGAFGATISEVVVNVFRTYAREAREREGKVHAEG